ncbi:universal stress protein family protein [mine drainage metagenome]|uniref:Universal stress protein family protein n=1 Tax=mine drainage metagenome TaxID=410659 RepID=A0A1J5SVB7_9ZZZZ
MQDRRKPPAKTNRTFLVVVDDTEEMRAALRYACRRARNTGGRVALLRVLEPSEMRHYAAIGDLIRDEARAAAESLLEKLAAEIGETSGEMPAFHVREGLARDELLGLINEDPSISILVLAAGTGKDGPGPLVSALTGKYVNKLRVPVTIVPGTLSDADIDALT